MSAIIIICAGLALAAGERYPAEGAVTAVKGSVTARAAGGAGRALKVKDLVYAGDVVETGQDASVKIKLGDGSELMVPARSRIAISDSRGSPRGYGAIGVLMGRIWAYVASEDGPSGFEIETVTTVTGVRGTIVGQGVRVDGMVRVVVDRGAVRAGRDGAARIVNQGGALDLGLDGKATPGRAGNSEQDWQAFFKQGQDNLHKNPQGLMALMLAGLKSARDETEIERAGLRAAIVRLRGVLKDIEGKPRIIIPDQDKQRAADAATDALSRLKRTRILLGRFRAFLDLIRQALADLAGDPGAYPGAAGDAVRNAGAAANAGNPDKYIKDAMDELAGMAGELEDDVMRLDLAPRMKRLPERKKSDRINQEAGGSPNTPPGQGPPTGPNQAPDLPPTLEPQPGPPPPPPEPQRVPSGTLDRYQGPN